MLINLYNGKPVNDFKGHYATVGQILLKQRMIQMNTGQKDLTSEALFEFFHRKIDGIMQTVQDKILDDSIASKIVLNYVKGGDNQDLKLEPYAASSSKYDEILSAVADYFTLFKNNTNKLEDLWL
jgi:hypothetical protein